MIPAKNRSCAPGIIILIIFLIGSMGNRIARADQILATGSNLTNADATGTGSADSIATGTSATATGTNAANAASQTASLVTTYEGQVQPRDFVPLSAPQNTVRLPFMMSCNSGIQILELLPEGAIVKAGQVVATFSFRFDYALPRLNQWIADLYAQRDETVFHLEEGLDSLRLEVDRGRLKAREADLDLIRKDTLAKIKQKLLETDAKLLEFEADALQQRLDAAKANIQKQSDLFGKRIAQEEQYLKDFFAIRAQYSLKAPVGGTLFYPMMRRETKLGHDVAKVKTGDNMNSGAHFLSVVTSLRSELVFPIPEGQLYRFSPGTRVTATGENTRELHATIRTISYFPELIGETQDNFTLPDAWEKCFMVCADIDGEADPGKIGTVRVRVAE
ncbi:MAG: hypothetical protein HQM09_18165 [Candidatus Riflebacteria bacterium]|nr:hypothetical protein [Candidatus Riflebacteria bacterium]